MVYECNPVVRTRAFESAHTASTQPAHYPPPDLARGTSVDGAVPSIHR